MCWTCLEQVSHKVDAGKGTQVKKISHIRKKWDLKTKTREKTILGKHLYFINSNLTEENSKKISYTHAATPAFEYCHEVVWDSMQ